MKSMIINDDNHNYHDDNDDNHDNRDHHDNQDNQVRLAHLWVDFRVISIELCLLIHFSNKSQKKIHFSSHVCQFAPCC